MVCAVTETSLFRGVKHAACETVENEEEGGEKVDFGAICCELLFLQAMHELSKIDKKFCTDSDRRVPAELGQESQASSCLRTGTPLASPVIEDCRYII